MKRSKRIAIIAAVILIAAGLAVSACAMFAMGFDFKKMNTLSFVSNTYTLEEAFTSISIDGAECDISLYPSQDGTCKVVCREGDKISHTVFVENNTLIIERHDNREWYDHIGVYWGSMEIALYLPEKEYESLYAKTLSGDIVVPDGFSFGSVSVQTTSGDIGFQAAVTGDLSARTVSGELYVGNGNPDKLTAESTSGDIQLFDVRCQTITVNTTSGKVDLSDVIAREKIQIESVSGEVELHRCDAGSLWLKSVSGDISGVLLTEKCFIPHTTSGDVDIPLSGSGGECEVITTSGDIDFDIQD